MSDLRNTARRFIKACARAIPCKIEEEKEDKGAFSFELDGWVYIDGPETIEVWHPFKGAKTACKRRVPGFIVRVASITPATRHEPETADVTEVSEHRVLGEAVIAAFTLIAQNALRGAIDAESEALYFEQYEKDKGEQP